jgi:caffeoyl-CoA O-methyltransferase
MADNDSRKGTSYLSHAILAYADATHAPHDEALRRAFEAPEHAGLEPIQLGACEAKLVALLLQLAGARKVVELGTLAGYSALVMARALPADGHLWSVEYDPRAARVARENIAAAGLATRVTVVEGAALEVLPSLEQHGPFDAVFLDADKGNYDAYGRWAAAWVRPGGLLIGDNAALFGRLVNANDAEAAAMRRFHEEARAAFDTTCVPTPDGLVIGVRRATA